MGASWWEELLMSNLTEIHIPTIDMMTCELAMISNQLNHIIDTFSSEMELMQSSMLYICNDIDNEEDCSYDTIIRNKKYNQERLNEK